MLFSINIINNNNLDCNWDTFYVGRKLKFITIADVQKYAIEYLSKNEDIGDLNKIELAWDLPEDKVDELLFSIVGLKAYDDKGYSTSLDVEYRKWRYCALKHICLNAKDDKQLFSDIEDIFCLYEYPKDMRELFSKCSDIFYYGKDYGYTMHDLVNNFLKEERIHSE